MPENACYFSDGCAKLKKYVLDPKVIGLEVSLDGLKAVDLILLSLRHKFRRRSR